MILIFMCLCLYQWAGILQIVLFNSLRRHQGNRADGVGPGSPGSSAGRALPPRHKHVVHIPALQVLVQRRGFRVVAHHRARPTLWVETYLVRSKSAPIGRKAHAHAVRIQLFGDIANDAFQVLLQLELVLFPVKGHAQQRLTAMVGVVRIQIQIDIAVRTGRWW